MKPSKKPMDCRSARELMFDYLDDAASKSEASSLEAHLLECDVCKKELEERKNILDMVKLAAVNPPKELKSGVMKKIENIPQEKVSRRFIPSARVASALAIAACAVIMLAVGFRGMLFPDISVADASNKSQGDVVYTAHIPAVNTASAGLSATYAKGNKAYANSVKYTDTAAPAVSMRLTGAETSGYGSAVIRENAADNSIKISRGIESEQIDKVYDYAVNSVDENIGVIVGYAGSLAEIIPDTEMSEGEFGGIKCEYFTITENCLAFAAKLLKGEVSANTPWRAHLPAGVEIAELRLIVLAE